MDSTRHTVWYDTSEGLTNCRWGSCDRASVPAMIDWLMENDGRDGRRILNVRVEPPLPTFDTDTPEGNRNWAAKMRDEGNDPMARHFDAEATRIERYRQQAAPTTTAPTTKVVPPYMSRGVVAALRKAGYRAFEPGRPGFRVWSVRGGEPMVNAYGFPTQAERADILARFVAVLDAAGFDSHINGHMIFVTGRK